MSNPINHRYDFAYFFDVTDGNPNGDPDAGNLPRFDPETGHGLVTDVCLKRKIRNYVCLSEGDKPPYEIYVKEKAILYNQQQRAYDALGLVAKKRKDKEKAKGKKKEKDEVNGEQEKQLTAWMCKNFFDIRTFGAVMATKVNNCGQVRGPIQLSFARSVTRIMTLEHALTRCAVTTPEESKKQSGGNRTMGRKFSIPYALYKTHGFINPFLAEKTGFSEDDLQLFKAALGQMFEYDRSASRGLMTPRACFAFKHESQLGNARADELFALISQPAKRPELNGDAPRSYADYIPLDVDEKRLPAGVTLERWV